MDEVLRHFLVFFPLFTFIRFKFRRLTLVSFILLPFFGEWIQGYFPASWGFLFEWGDVAVNYVSSLTGWAAVAAYYEQLPEEDS